MPQSVGTNHPGFMCLNADVGSGSLEKGLRFTIKQPKTPNITYHRPWTVETILSKKRKHEVPNGIGVRLHLDEVIVTGRTATTEWQIQHLKLKMTLELKGGCVLRHNS